MKRSYLILHTAVILAGFTGIFGKLISLNEGLLTWYRVFFSFIWLFFILKIFKIDASLPLGQKTELAKIGMLITIHWVFFYGSIKYSNISIGVVCYSLTSFFTAVFEPLINRKKFAVTEFLLSALTLLGIALIFHFDSSYQLGISLGVISAAFAALYTIYNERLVKVYDSKLINYYQTIGRTSRYMRSSLHSCFLTKAGRSICRFISVCHLSPLRLFCKPLSRKRRTGGANREKPFPGNIYFFGGPVIIFHIILYIV